MAGIGVFITMNRTISYLIMSLLLAACSAQITPVPSQPNTTQPPPAPMAAPAGSIIARLTFFAGEVLFEPPALNPPVVMQAIAQGTAMQLGTNGLATVTCINNRVYQLAGQGRYLVTTQSCDNGLSLPSSACALGTSGTVCDIAGSKVIVAPDRTKEGDYGSIPVILSPRNSSLMELTPMIEWVDVGEASEYELSLSGPGSFDDLVLASDELVCRDEPLTAPNRVCSASWPLAWALQPGKRYFLTVSARTGIASPLRESENSALRTLDEATVEQVQADVEKIEALNLDAATTDLLLAGLYAQNALYAQAIPLYEQIVSQQPAPALYNTLGDGYRLVDLQRHAAQAYMETLRLLDEGIDDPVARAAAEYGLGQVEFSRLNYEEAEKHFAKAVELYAQGGSEAELQAAQDALEETQARL